jgi:dolichol kinase
LPKPDALKSEAALSWKGELYRKGIHLSSLIIPIGFLLLDPRAVLTGLMGGLLFFALFDILRFFGNDDIKRFMGMNFGFLLRPREKKSFSGATTILLAGLLVYTFYEVKVAAAAMVIIVIGDIFAALIGRSFGRIRVFAKTVEGSVAFIISTALAVQFIPGLSLRVAFIGCLVGAIIELLPLPIDDNITVPMIAGGFMQMVLANQQMLQKMIQP